MPIVVAEDSSRPFLPSSPSNGIVSARDGYISADPQSTHYGDVHFYWTWGDVWKWNIYPSGKFISEYGFQSWSSLGTLGKYISSSHFKYPLDEAFEHREHQENGLSYLNGMIKANLPLPSNGSASKLQDYIYISQVHQSMAIKIETEFYRRNRQVQTNGEGFTMGALYWQLNDIWPTVSWSSIEFGGKWKMLHYYVQNMFDNLLINAYEEENGQLSVVIIRDDHIQTTIPFKVIIQVYKWSSNKPAFQMQVDSSTKAFSVTMAFQQNIDQLLHTAQCSTRDDCFIQVGAKSIFNGYPVERSNFLLLGPIKNAVSLKKAQIHANIINVSQRDSFGVMTFLLHLSSDHVAPFVHLDFASPISGIFSDNGFFLTDQKNVTFQTVESVDKEKILDSLTVKSLKDVE